MKTKKLLQNLAGALIIITIVMMSFSNFIPTANAQIVGSGAISSGSGTSVSGYIQNLSPIIKQLPGCTALLGGGTKDLWKSVKASSSSTTIDQNGSGADVPGGDGGDPKSNTLDTKADAAGAEAQSVMVSDTASITKLNEIQAEQKIQGENIKTSATANASVDKNQTCLNSIGKAIIKTMINKLTLSIVDWINNGNNGEAFYLKDQSKFFGDLAKNQILSFTSEISDPLNFPFGRAFTQNIKETYNAKFQDYARYSLNNIIQQDNAVNSDVAFYSDFSRGGWNAFQAMVQNPANNPIGFQMLASKELEQRTAEEAAQKNAQLTQSGGFLDMQLCADPRGVTKEEDDKARKEISQDSQGQDVSMNPDFQNINGAATLNNGGNTVQVYTNYRRCNRWETVTPGYMIADKMTSTMKDNNKSLVDASTLNDAVAAILDSLLAKFTAKWTTGGLSSFSNTDNWNDTTLIDDSLGGNPTPQTMTDFNGYQRNSSSWLEQHPTFNIRTDLNQALIDEQRTYIDKLEEQNVTLPKLIKSIYQLDYCIPGPHPGWEDDAQNNIRKKEIDLEKEASAFKAMTDTVSYDFLNTISLGASATTMDYVSTAYDCGDPGLNRVGKLLKEFYSKQLTGINEGNIAYKNSSLCSVEGLDAHIQSILEQYTKLIAKRYNIQKLPTVAAEAAQKFEKIPGYEKMVQNNKDAIAFQTSVVNRLTNIKEKVDALKQQLLTGQITQDTFENDTVNGIRPWIDAFARLSMNMISPNDIAQVANLSLEAQDENDYVVNSLLQGPSGCEMELKNNPQFLIPADMPSSLAWQITYQKRPAYPKPHMYEVSPVTGYDYVNLPIHQGPASTNGPMPTTFLNGVNFYDSNMLGKWYPGVKWSGTNTLPNWVGSIDLHDGQNGLLNWKSPYFGGNVLYFENTIGIY